MANIAAGSIVQLKSGSPYMTVMRVYSPNGGSMSGVPHAEYQWFDKTTPHEKSFPLTSLDIVDMDEGPIEPQF